MERWSEEQMRVLLLMLRRRDVLKHLSGRVLEDAERLYEEARQAWAQLVPGSERAEIDLLQIADLQRLYQAAYGWRSAARHMEVLKLVRQEAAEQQVELAGLDYPILFGNEGTLSHAEAEWWRLVEQSGWPADVSGLVMAIADQEVREEPVDYFTLADLMEHFRHPLDDENFPIAIRSLLSRPPKFPGKPLSEYLDEVRGDFDEPRPSDK